MGDRQLMNAAKTRRKRKAQMFWELCNSRGPSPLPDDHAEQQCQTQEHVEPVEPTQPQSRKAYNETAVVEEIAWEKYRIAVFEFDHFVNMDRYHNWWYHLKSAMEFFSNKALQFGLGRYGFCNDRQEYLPERVIKGETWWSCNDTKYRHFQWQDIVAQLDDESMRLLVRGIDGRSRGITFCALQGNRWRTRWDLTMRREDGSGVTLYLKSETPIVRCDFWKLRYGPWVDPLRVSTNLNDRVPEGYDEYSQRIVEEVHFLEFDMRKAPCLTEPPEKRQRTSVKRASTAAVAESNFLAVSRLVEPSLQDAQPQATQVDPELPERAMKTAAVAATPAVAACSGDEDRRRRSYSRSRGSFRPDPPEPPPSPTPESSQDTEYGYPECWKREVAEVATEESKQFYAKLNDSAVVAKHPTDPGGETDVVAATSAVAAPSAATSEDDTISADTQIE